MAKKDIILYPKKKKEVYTPSKGSFAYGINFYKLFWIFFLGCIIGFFVETVWCLINKGYIESRKGLIYGPFSPVYGIGAVLITLILYRFKKSNSMVIFLFSALVGGAFEYLASLIQEYIFGAVSWEYSDYPLNLDGRTNLFFCVCWGILGLIFIRSTLPFIERILSKIPVPFGKKLSIILAILLSADIIISSAAVLRQYDRKNNMSANSLIEQFLDEKYDDEFLLKVFPNMIFT